MDASDSVFHVKVSKMNTLFKQSVQIEQFIPLLIFHGYFKFEEFPMKNQIFFLIYNIFLFKYEIIRV